MKEFNQGRRNTIKNEPKAKTGDHNYIKILEKQESTQLELKASKISLKQSAVTLKKQKSPHSRAEQNKNVFGKIHEKLTIRA